MIKLLIPDMPSTDELIPFLRRIDTNRHYTNYGPLNSELETALKPYLLLNKSESHDNLHVTTIANATLGLEVILQALNIPAHSEVLVPSLTFPATASAVIRQGCYPVFSDIDEEVWHLTPAIAREAVSRNPGIRLVIPVAAFGVPVPINDWDNFAIETGIPVVIDAAGAFGNQLIGTTAHIVYSLHATKALGGGEGGFIATRDHTLHKQIRILSNFGLNPDCCNTVVDVGTNAKMSEYHAAVTLASLSRWSQRYDLRQSVLSRWLEALAPLIREGKIITQAGLEQYAVTLLPLRFSGISSVSELGEQLQQRSIQTRRWYCPILPEHPGFARYKVASDLRNAKKISSELLGLPFHLDLECDNIRHIVRVVGELLSSQIVECEL